MMFSCTNINSKGNNSETKGHMLKKAFKQEDEWIEFLYFSPIGRVGM